MQKACAAPMFGKVLQKKQGFAFSKQFSMLERLSQFRT